MVSSNPPPLPVVAGDVTFGAAGVDFGLVKLVRLENGEDLSVGFEAGADALDGKLNPLKASVNPPRFDEV